MCKTTTNVNELLESKGIAVTKICEAADMVAKYKAQYETMEKTYKGLITDELVALMIENDIDYIETPNGNRISLVRECEKKILDVDKVKEEGLYEHFAKTIISKAHIMLTKARKRKK